MEGHTTTQTAGPASTVGEARHAAAVDRLVAACRELPPGAPIRLRKPTSNLFRGRDDGSAGVEVSDLTGVVSIDPVARTADVQGMCTYEDLVAATLPHGLIPLVVPQLRTITLGGAVTGLGIESTSFRNGLPHESVTELDVLTGAGEVVTARPEGDRADLFAAFPNSYGSLGYATRLRIELEPVPSYVALRHVRLAGPGQAAEAIAEVCASAEYDGVRVDALDGVAFSPEEIVLTLATWTDEPGPTSDYTGQQIYYRSLQQRTTDRLTINDYLWRWDTDWFWCSRAFGVQHPAVRRVWPRRWRRSDVYHRLVGWDRRLGLVDRIDRVTGRQPQERVIQDVEVPAERLGEFLRWFDDHVGMRPVWLCPLRLREPDGPGSARSWPCYPLAGGETYVNLGFWGGVRVAPGEDPAHAPYNRAVERRVAELDGHKSLYSEAFYDPDTFHRLYGGDQLAAVKRRYDPEDRLTSLYDKAVRRR